MIYFLHLYFQVFTLFPKLFLFCILPEPYRFLILIKRHKVEESSVYKPERQMPNQQLCVFHLWFTILWDLVFSVLNQRQELIVFQFLLVHSVVCSADGLKTYHRQSRSALPRRRVCSSLAELLWSPYWR